MVFMVTVLFFSLLYMMLISSKEKEKGRVVTVLRRLSSHAEVVTLFAFK